MDRIDRSDGAHGDAPRKPDDPVHGAGAHVGSVRDPRSGVGLLCRGGSEGVGGRDACSGRARGAGLRDVHHGAGKPNISARGSGRAGRHASGDRGGLRVSRGLPRDEDGRRCGRDHTGCGDLGTDPCGLGWDSIPRRSRTDRGAGFSDARRKARLPAVVEEGRGRRSVLRSNATLSHDAAGPRGFAVIRDACETGAVSPRARSAVQGLLAEKCEPRGRLR